MATPLTPGKIYFIEAAGDLGAKTNWIDVGGDPDTIDIEQFTEGLTYAQINIPRGFTVNSITGIIVTPSGAGKSYDERNASRWYRVLERGMQTSLANANIIEKFAMSDRHISGASAVFVRYFMIIYFGTNAHVEFTDPNDNRKSYCRGVILALSRQWIDSNSLVFLIRINWDSVW